MSAQVQHEIVETVTPKTEGVLTTMSNIPRPRIPGRLARAREGFNRQDVINAFNEAFEQMGGVRRLALWADQNPGEFFKLYAKLLPSSSQDVNTGTTIVIQHAVPRSTLDVVDVEVVRGDES